VHEAIQQELQKGEKERQQKKLEESQNPALAGVGIYLDEIPELLRGDGAFAAASGDKSASDRAAKLRLLGSRRRALAAEEERLYLLETVMATEEKLRVEYITLHAPYSISHTPYMHHTVYHTQSTSYMARHAPYTHTMHTNTHPPSPHHITITPLPSPPPRCPALPSSS
jgi:hypothetical protein